MYAANNYNSCQMIKIAQLTLFYFHFYFEIKVRAQHYGVSFSKRKWIQTKGLSLSDCCCFVSTLKKKFTLLFFFNKNFNLLYFASILQRCCRISNVFYLDLAQMQRKQPLPPLTSSLPFPSHLHRVLFEFDVTRLACM